MHIEFSPTICRLLLLLILASCTSGEAAGPSHDTAVGPDAMRQSAIQLLESLDGAQQDQITFTLADTSARTNWSNLPSAMFERGGIRTGDLSEVQRHHLHDLLRASTSSQGYLKIVGVMWLDDILREEAMARGNVGSGFRRRLIESWQTENYWVSVFGNPATDSNWAWMITGHHLAASFTVAGDEVAFTPLFLGAEPYTLQGGPYTGWRILSHEVSRGFALVQSLSSAQREHAVLGTEVPRDILTGPGRRTSLTQLEGVPASSLNDGQQALLQQLIEEYVRNADSGAADAQMDRISADGWNTLHFAWIGPTDDINARYYYRVHGPSILIEYIRERGVGTDAPANHIHTIVRDPSNDYGEDWLGLHYREHHDSQ